jgi:hypothetical protein
MHGKSQITVASGHRVWYGIDFDDDKSQVCSSAWSFIVYYDMLVYAQQERVLEVFVFCCHSQK